MVSYKFGENMTIDKFLHQIGGEVVDLLEGTLQDSFFVAGKRGYYFLKDTFVNTWSSVYTVFFAAYKNIDDVNELFKMWDDFAGAPYEILL